MYFCFFIRIVHDVRKAVREDGYRPFTHLMEMTHFLSVLDKNTPRMPRIMWNDDAGEVMVFDGHLITTTSFRMMYQKLLRDTKEMLLDKVLLGLEFPDLHHDHIHDELNNSEPGYSFISDKRNKFHNNRDFLISSILNDSKHGDRFHYHKHTSGSTIAWNTEGILEWFRICEVCIGNLFALTHYGSGQPARGTELAIFAPENTTIHRRSVYFYRGYINLVSIYNKTQTNTGKPRVIGRSLPQEVADLYVLWLTFVVPAEDYLWNCWKREPADPCRFRHRLFTGISGNFTTDDFSAILSSLSGERVVDSGMGHAMGMADTRHYLIAIMREYCRGIPDRNFLERYFNEQSGHGEDAAENYAITFSSILNVSDDHLDKFVEISKLQHRLLFPDTVRHGDIVKSGSSAGISDSTTIDYHKLSALIANALEQSPQKFSRSQLVPLASQVATLLAPGMKQNIADAISAISPITLPQNRAVVSGGAVQPHVSSAAEPILVDVSEVEISPARWTELRQLMGPNAVFKSSYQACAVELSAQRKNDLLVVLGTGGGKSLVFMLCAVNEDEDGLTTIVIVPLVALALDLARRLRNKKIRVAMWSNTTSYYSAQVTIVVSETAASEGFLSYFLKGCREKKIARVVVDEIHTIHTDNHYRPLLSRIKDLRQGDVQFIGLSATILPAAVTKTMELMHFLPGNTLLIRAPTQRKEIAYSVFEIIHTSYSSSDPAEALYRDADDGQSRKVIDYIKQSVSRYSHKERALIFCKTKNDAENFAHALECNLYHADVTEKESILESWRSGTNKALVATSALGAGFDYPTVELVVNYQKPRNIIDFSQESGRGGRELLFSRSTVFWDPTQKDWKLARGQDDIGRTEMTDYLTTSSCRRVSLGISLDGKMYKTCLQDGTVALCDLCFKKIRNAPVVSQLILTAFTNQYQLCPFR